MNTATLTTESVLSALTRQRLYDLARTFGFRLRPGREQKQDVVRHLVLRLGEGGDRLAEVLRELGRDELRAVCRAHALDDSSAVRNELIAAIAESAGVSLDAREDSAGRTTSFHRDGVPQPGQILTARGRQWLVEDVVAPDPAHSPLLRLACLDDDAAGRQLELLWDLELGARVVDPKTEGLGEPRSLDPPASFGAYLHALQWSAVSAADATRFQAPFRAGIKLMAHQLTPLMKALELPRANLFIADDVGLGKTIEAGLVLQELVLRQQADFVLIVCPAAICLQWRDEMMRRFGLRFEVMTRHYVARCRVERGFGVNPWATHNRFIVSYPILRRPEYRDPLLAHLGDDGTAKELLILDEAHVAAPASASKYAVDSDTTRTIRDLAPRFDNRLFLSATPHNGHSNSFSALLEILDPVRFTRGVKVDGAEALTPVMVRRLKRDLRQLGVEKFPERILCRIDLEHGDDGWNATEQRRSADTQAVLDTEPLASGLGGDPAELELSRMLADYTDLCAPKSGRARLVFVNLQKRLLSSPEAFARTLDIHAEAVERRGGVHVEPTRAERAADGQRELPLTEPAAHSKKRTADDAHLDAETYGVDDDALAAEEDIAVEEATHLLPSPDERAASLLKQMRAVAHTARTKPDGKTRALLAWLREHCCPAIGAADSASRSKSKSSSTDGSWTDRRVILFTEYADTKRYLHDILTHAIEPTDRGDERLLVFHGGMGDEARDEVQRAFNTPPSEHPVRILLATDAAREGVNLQAFCSDLFHIDVPWNPSRMEQRNGRIDRTLQDADEVRCHYFVYPQRTEDRVLETLVRKIETVQRELGSVGAVLLDEMESTLANGITEASEGKLDAIGDDARARTADEELESQRKQLDTLQDEVHRAARRLDASERALAVEPDALRGVVEIGLRIAGANGLTQTGTTSGGHPTWSLPELDSSWDATLDTLRPPRGRDEPFWEWRKRAPRDVTFHALERLTEHAEQLHLAHPLVRRILGRFLAQGYGAHDLSRTCAVVVPGENVSRAIAYARLTLFGRGAARLHDEILAIAAPWAPGEVAGVQPYKDAATAARARDATERALAADCAAPADRIATQIREAADDLYAALWPHLENEADARAADARNGLSQRARRESDELRKLLERQRDAITKAGADLRQTTFMDLTDKTQRRQLQLDLEHLDARKDRIAQELEEEPIKIEALYDVQMTRLTPVGLVVAWPESMT